MSFTQPNPTLLGHIIGLDMTAAASTNIGGLIPEGIWIIDAFFYPNTLAVYTVAPTVGVSVVAGSTIFSPVAFTGTNSSNGWAARSLGVSPFTQTGDQLQIDVTVGATATTCTFDCYIYGYRIG